MTKKELEKEVRRLRSENRKLMQIIHRMAEKVIPAPQPIYPVGPLYDPLRDIPKYGENIP